MTIAIESFPNDDKYWRVDWFGGVSYDPNEPKIRVFLSQINSDTPREKILNKNAININGSSNSIFRDIKIGYIQILKIGSVWKNRIKIWEYDAPFTKLSFESNHPRELVYLTAKGYTTLQPEGWVSILTDTEYSLTNSTAKKGSPVLIYFNVGIYEYVVIPCPVIFQSCYVSSPKAARHIIFGQMDQLLDLNSSGYIENEDSIFRIHLHKNYADSEAPCISNLVTDQEAKKYIKYLQRTLSLSANNLNPEKLNALAVGFPFSNDLKINVKGRVLFKENNKKAFFVTEICSAYSELSFKKLLILRKNNNRKSGNKAEEVKPGWNTPIPQQNNSHDDTDANIVLLNDGNPSSQYDPIRDYTSLVLYPEDLEIIKETPDLQHFENLEYTNIIGSIVNNSNLASSGPKTTTQNGISEYDVEILPPANLDFIFSVFSHLRKSGIDFKLLPIMNEHSQPEGLVNRFDRHIRHLRSWHLQIDGLTPRAFVIGEVLFYGQYYYLIDIEPKNKESLSIIFISPKSGLKIANSEFKLMFYKLARTRSWSFLNTVSFEQKWSIIKFRHDRNNNFADLSQKIEALIKG